MAKLDVESRTEGGLGLDSCWKQAYRLAVISYDKRRDMTKRL